MGICISTAKLCITTGEDVLNDFLDGQSRYYKESKQAKEHLDKQNNASAANTNSNGSHTQQEHAVLQADISPIYPTLPKFAMKYHCKSVYDGDTLTLQDGTKVRLLGVDTPEIKEKQPFALEAKEYTKRYCHNNDVWLTLLHDEQGSSSSSSNKAGKDDKNKDHYGRLLAFIWVPLHNNNDNKNDDTKGEKRKRQKQQQQQQQWLCINEGLIASGLAHVYSPSKSKRVHNHDKLLRLQKLARTNKRGIWKDYKDYTAIITPNGGAFHKSKKKKSIDSDCKYLSRSNKNNLSLVNVSEAYDRGLHPCRNCFG